MLSLHNFQIDDGQPNFVNIQQDSGSIHQLSRYGTHMYNHVHTHTHTQVKHQEHTEQYQPTNAFEHTCQ